MTVNSLQPGGLRSVLARARRLPTLGADRKNIIRVSAPTLLPPSFHRLVISLTRYYLFFVIKKLFFCNSNMSCYPASIKRVKSRIRHNKRDNR